MRVLIFHGYLLRGTGSNIYNANLAQALAGLGHEVHLLCQDLDADRLEWVDAVGRWERGRPRGRERSGSPPRAGSVTAYLPEIGGLLPLYVQDSYEGFEARVFDELSDEEIERYLSANVAAVGDVVAAAGGVDAALANHLVMGPAILARSGLPFAAKVHGSALEYTVKAEPGALRPLRPRGGRGRRGDAGRLPPHGGEPLGGAPGPGARGPDPPRPPGRGRPPFPPALGGRAGRGAGRAGGAGAAESRRSRGRAPSGATPRWPPRRSANTRRPRARG